MPPMETRRRHQKAVLWAAAEKTEFGRRQVYPPVELDVRWQNKDDTTTRADGATVRVDAQVVVDREIEPDSIMWLGELEDWYGTGSAGDDSGLMVVVSFSNIPNTKGRRSRLVCKLQRFRDALPEVSSG
jgi:hypothetical protein